MTKSQLFVAGGVSLLLGILVLCFSGGSGDSTVEVAGVVYLDSQPLANADVFFLEEFQPSGQTDKKLQRAHGRTDENGRYELVSGAMPGSYRVIVRALVGGDQQAIVPGLGSDGLDIAQLEAASAAVETAQQAASQNYGYRTRRPEVAKPKSLPPVYSSAEQTVLRVGVPEEGTEYADLCN
jgi:ABC-type phosphate/phosphonate transport system substrate-binding protein